MKALSLTQPWATLVAIGAKRIETRSWTTSHRGLIAIHASKGFPKWARETCAEEPFYSVLQEHGRQWIEAHHGCSPRAVFEDAVMPLGEIVAVAMLRSVRVISADLPAAYGEAFPNAVWHTAGEIPFGDYAEGRFAWLLDGVVRLPKPIPCKGALGLWTVPDEIEQQLRGPADVVPTRRSA